MSSVGPGSFTFSWYLRQRVRLTRHKLGIAVGYSDNREANLNEPPVR